MSWHHNQLRRRQQQQEQQSALSDLFAQVNQPAVQQEQPELTLTDLLTERLRTGYRNKGMRSAPRRHS